MSTFAWLALAFAAVVVALLLAAWALTPPDQDEAPVLLGDTFPRCGTCPFWPGPDKPCPKKNEPQERNDGCTEHPKARAQADRRRRKETAR